MSKIAFIFAGQGSQSVGMAKDFVDHPFFQDIDSKLKEIMLNGPQELLNQTQYAQPALFATGILLAEALLDQGITPDYVAGLSLGEYTALGCAKVFSKEDGLKITSFRGNLMQNALLNADTGMMAVLGAIIEDITSAIQQTETLVEFANFNCPGQIVLTGKVDGLLKVKEILETNRKAKRCLMLNCSGAFHSSLLIPASKQLNTFLESFSFSEPCYNVVYNTYGTESSEPIKDILTRQICTSVKMEQSILYLIEQGVDTFIEIGPGKTISGFIKKINSQVNIYSVASLADIHNLQLKGGMTI